MVLDDTVRDLIMHEGSSATLREAARKRGMRTLREGGLLGIYDGLTTIEEVVSQTVVETLE
jgi:type IV pilus assembly protein PilB